ncbi:ATP-binding protein [Bradyrhizobium sp. UFLA05-112]
MRPVSEWTEVDLDELHRGQIMESQKLEYKDSRALGNTDHQKSELFKDVSAMANSSGGIIVYGMKERGHLPEGTDEGFDPSVIKREWLENILTANIDPKIEDLYIKAVILESKGAGRVAYVLAIPQAKSHGPHQGPEHKYYKRYNFKAEPMENYEVRDLMRRGIEYGRKYGAAFDLFVEIARLGTAAGARAGAGMAALGVDKAIIGVSPDLRSAGAVLVLMTKYMRNAVGELVQKVDGYNSKVEARGGSAVIIDASLKGDLTAIHFLADRICTELQKILDEEP